MNGLYLWLLRRRQTACRRCPHDRDSHPSYIPGGSKPGWCMACKCYQYQPERAWTLALAYIRDRPPPVTADVLRPRPVPYPVPGWAEDDDDRTLLGLRVAPYVGAVDETRLRAPRPRRRGSPW